MKNIIIILAASVLMGCEMNTVNSPCLIYGDTREIVDTVYLNSNDVHVDIVLPTGTDNYEEYTSFGWGAEYFFLNVPTWTEFKYLDFMHVIKNSEDVVIRETVYNNKQKNWIPVPVDQYQLNMLRQHISDSYEYTDEGYRIKVPDKKNNGKYYRATGKYTFFYTCNTWTNNMLKYSSLYARKQAYLAWEITDLYK